MHVELLLSKKHRTKPHPMDAKDKNLTMHRQTKKKGANDTTTLSAEPTVEADQFAVSTWYG